MSDRTRKPANRPLAPQRGASVPGSATGTDPGTAPALGKGKRVRNDPNQAEMRRKMRARIEAVAREMFTTEPWQDVTIRRIAARIGCTISPIYYYYETKEALWRAVMGYPAPTSSPQALMTHELEVTLRSLVTTWRADDPDALSKAMASAQALLDRLPNSGSDDS
jgi:AcrR family transcriptional regulator